MAMRVALDRFPLCTGLQKCHFCILEAETECQSINQSDKVDLVFGFLVVTVLN